LKTTKEIYQEMHETFKETSGVELNDGGDMAVRMYAAAAQIHSLYLYNEWILKQGFPQYAVGEYLDLQAQMRGLQRNGAVKAEGIIRFMIENALPVDIRIDAGTVCMTTEGTEFITIEEGTIAAGTLSCDVPAQAEIPGEGGNVAAETVIFMTAPPVGVSACCNVHKFAGGLDAESDESLRRRILNSYKTLPNGANRAYYEKEAMEIDGVASVKVQPKVRGLGTVDIIVAGINGMPTQELIDAVKSSIDSKREICVDIQVKAPIETAVDINVLIDVEDGYDFDTVKIATEEAINAHFNGSLLSKGILIADIGDIVYHVKGVKNYRIISPTEDITSADDALPVIGTLNVEAWSL